jgi:hypothetical protein
MHMSGRVRWPCRVAAVLAVAAGVLLLLGGYGHLSAVLETRAGQPFDYRFVSLLTTSGILMFPGLVGLLASYWLWHGKVAAYVACLLSASALMLYLALLVYMKTQVQEAATSAGPEVYFFTALVSGYLVVTAAVLLWLQRSRLPEPSAA